LTTWKTPPDPAVGEARQNSGAEASPDRQRIGKPAHEKGLCALCGPSAHILFGNAPQAGQDDQINYLIILIILMKKRVSR
jgi:hypothetical protein